tara:strand:- start:426 stop:560 length:135 start_codon:yes stop_codon:yes gene_type:complete
VRFDEFVRKMTKPEKISFCPYCVCQTKIVDELYCEKCNQKKVIG